MVTNNKSVIIGICGISGAGKTALTKALTTALHATDLYWDDFDDISVAPKDYVIWYERGQNYTEWNYSALATTLRQLKQGLEVNHPVFNHQLKPKKYIVFDAPLGRLHKQTGTYIDILVHVETPLDIALARRLHRDFADSTANKEDMISELKFYLSTSRKLYSSDLLKVSADLILDGAMSVTEQVKKLVVYINHYSTR